jgi:hypothetical protein
MRRPRGPGGRFLTAEEIAAQRSPTSDEPGPSTAPEHDEDMEDDDAEAMQPMAMPQDSYMHSDSMAMMNMAYRDMLPPQQQQQQQQQAQAQQQQQHQQQPQQHHQHQHHQPLQHPSALFTQQQQHSHSHSHGASPITLSSPYAASMQMHHVPHPHAHARHRHLTFAQDMYGANPDAEMQRRTDEMIQFAAGPSGS